MALYLPETKTLYVHIPKTGGHWVEELLKRSGIQYRHAKRKPGKSPRHGMADDYDEDVSNSFCTFRDFDDWMLSYWRFHIAKGNRLDWFDTIDYPHRHLGPPLTSWQQWSTERRLDCHKYLESMRASTDTGVPLCGTAGHLRTLGYNITDEQAAAVPRQNPTILKVELGGGTRARGDGFANIDIDPAADLMWDLNEAPYPFPDDSVNEIYSSHCLEHLDCPHKTLQEIARICCVGSRVEIRVPHPASHMAMCAGHKHVFSPLMVENIDTHFPELHWTGPKRLKLRSQHYNPTTWLDDAKRELSFLSGLADQTIMKWIPNTAHETVFVFEVIKND